jgi:hypothetical protein
MAERRAIQFGMNVRAKDGRRLGRALGVVGAHLHLYRGVLRRRELAVPLDAVTLADGELWLRGGAELAHPCAKERHPGELLMTVWPVGPS